MQQEQFLNVLDREEAERRFQAVLDLSPLAGEWVPLTRLLGRTLSEDVISPVDVPGFDRSNVDGFAVRAEDLFGCSEEQPACLHPLPGVLLPGAQPEQTIQSGTALAISTGAMIPRGANAVVMVEHTETMQTPVPQIRVQRPVAPGTNITFAGTDVALGETILRRGELLTSRETGVLAAIGVAAAQVVRQPRVAILSTGDELVPPGAPLKPGQIYDSNGIILADAVREQGCEPMALGIVPDDATRLQAVLQEALACDVVVLSGGTSKGAGDVSYRVVQALGSPGIIAHGVALKPGKPLCLAAIQLPGRRPVPVVILPGFPTSAIFTFRDFLAPILRRLAGRAELATATVSARLPFRVNSERGRTEYLLVGLVPGATPADLASEQPTLTAYPMGKGSGSVTTFSRADGFLIIPRQREFVEAEETVTVHLLAGSELRLPDLVVIGSHCVGLDHLLGLLALDGIHSKIMAVGSSGGLTAAQRGECDLAGIHLLDPATGTYNRPFLTPDLECLPGYGRLQGIVFRPGDPRFTGQEVAIAVRAALADPDCILVNRNRGSGTRFLIERLLQKAQPPGYRTEVKSHNAVAAAVAQGRADWGVALEPVARAVGLGFLPVQEERFDLVVPRARRHRPAVEAFCRLLQSDRAKQMLLSLGFQP